MAVAKENLKIHFCPDGCLWSRQDLVEIHVALGMRAATLPSSDKTRRHILRLKKDAEGIVKAIDKNTAVKNA